ncbi:MAG: threonine synthase [Campylobacter sp.]|nr:threonine synthase [Campylobacter sp.]
MKLISTRDKTQKVSLKQALLNPSSNYGGLFVPKKFPKFNEEFFDELPNLDYKSLALKIISSFKFDIDLEVFEKALQTYEKFDDPNCPVAIKQIGQKLYINELYHGPTRAFKDMALQPFGSILSHLAKEDDKNYLIMCATSGDTGPATLESFANKDNIKVVCLYPANGTSEVQKLQMVTNSAKNVKVIGIEGNFDDAQTALKTLLNDSDFKTSLAKNSLSLSAANSVNFGRILFQIIYHFYANAWLVKNGIIDKDEKFDIVVPSGNFGNALGAYYAKKMGAKIKKIKIASNSNNVLTEFFNKGIYDIQNKSLIKTISPAMDILISSNIERLLFDKFGDKETKKFMEKLSNNKKYRVNKNAFKTFNAKKCSDDECSKFIKQYADMGILIDPHTATCFKFSPKNRPMIITSTAHWAKFTPSMIHSIKNREIQNEKDDMINLANEFDESLPKAITGLFDKEIIHKDILKTSEIKDRILDWINK